MLSFASCGKDNAQSSSGTSSKEQSNITFEQFLEKAEGFWIYTDTIEAMGDEYCYEFCTLSKEYFGGGVYPGGGSRPAKIVGFEQTGENVFNISLLYEAGNFMDEELPEERNTLVVILQKEGTATIKYGDAQEMHAVFGGNDFDSAQRAAADNAKHKDEK